MKSLTEIELGLVVGGNAGWEEAWNEIAATLTAQQAADLWAEWSAAYGLNQQ